MTRKKKLRKQILFYRKENKSRRKREEIKFLIFEEFLFSIFRDRESFLLHQLFVHLLGICLPLSPPRCRYLSVVPTHSEP
jgi:hypothetical protein